MLSRVFDCLGARGWFDTSRPFEYTINFTRGACVWLLLTRAGVPQTYVKFSEHISLLSESQRYAAASACHPALVPRFVGHRRHEGLDVMVCEAVDYLGLNAVRLGSPVLQHGVLDQLLPLFSAASRLELADDIAPLPNRELAAAMQPYFDATAQASRARRWLGQEALAWIARQPDVPQHGDLVLNNLGLRKDRSLIVFDWEDLGAICLPGLDLFTLEHSMSGSVAALLHARRQGTGLFQSFVPRACRASGLAVDEYRAMTPVYALAFRYLKRNYGPGARDRMDELLDALAREGEQV
jgi:hypothetical protein